MDTDKLKTFLVKGRDYFLPQLSVDIVVVGFEEGTLKVLLLELEDQWLLPGGYIFKEEAVEDAAKRILQERTGLERYYLQLLQIFGDAERSFPNIIQLVIDKTGLDSIDCSWMAERYVSLTYYALVDIAQAKPTGGILGETFAWHALQSLPKMWFDHKKIAWSVLEKMKENILSSHQFTNLLPEKFTMPELHQLHEHILEKKLDRSRFQKKMFSLDVFERLEEVKENVPHRKPYLYRLKK
ncbi:MAG: NUDIX domain-containing protein [Bacteroidota bacterium]